MAECIALKSGDQEMIIEYKPDSWAHDLGGPWSAGIGNMYKVVSLGEAAPEVCGSRRRTLRGALVSLRSQLRKTARSGD